MTTPETSYDPANYTSNDYTETTENTPETDPVDSALNRLNTFRSRLRLPELSPRRTVRVATACSLCDDRDYALFSKKHKMCYDCLVEKLSSAKLFSQGFVTYF